MILKSTAIRFFNFQVKRNKNVYFAQGCSLHNFSTVNNNLDYDKDLTQKERAQAKKFESLLTQNTDESLTQAAKMLGTLQNTSEQQENELRELNERMSFFPQNLLALLQKQKKLVENISLQEQDDQMIGKRLEKQLEDCKKFGVSKIAKQILEVSDALRHSLKLAKQIYAEQPENKQIKKIEAANQIVKKFFVKYGIQQFDPIGKPYDANTQQSMYQVPCPQGYKKNSVAQTLRTGFTIKGRLLRSARVGIFAQVNQS